MGYPVFYGHATVFFVGGNGDKSGRTALAGGCTKDWWDSQCPNDADAEKIAAMNKLMVNGAPVVDEAGCAYTAANTRTAKAGAFVGVEPGMVAYVVETPTPDANLATMRYLITAVDPAGDWIEIGEATGADATVTVKVGGAFDTLQNALDETSADYHSVWIFTNLSQTLAAPVDVDAGAGDVLRNTFKHIEGYGTAPGDMSRGGANYQSPLDILQNDAIDPTRCVALDANGGGFTALSVDGADNVIFENFLLQNTVGQNAVFFATACRNVVFRNCRFSNASCVVNTEADHLLFDHCYSHVDMIGHRFSLRGHNNVLLNCVARMSTGSNLVNVVGRAGAVIGCVVVGGQFGVRIVSTGGYATVLNNTFIATESDGVLLDACDGATVLNNIFCLAPSAVGIYARSGGSAVYNDNNCFIATDGTPLAATGTGWAGGEAPLAGAHSLHADPDFANAAGYDLRPRNPAVLRGGMPHPDGTPTVIGAIGQEYIFQPRAKIMNAGRMSILR